VDLTSIKSVGIENIVDVSFTAAFGPVLGLSRKMAIHCVMLLDNNRLLPSPHALCLAVFQLSAMVNETSTDPSNLSDLRLIYYGKAGFGHIPRIFSLNSQLFASKTREICLKPVFPSLRSLKSDRLLGQLKI